MEEGRVLFDASAYMLFEASGDSDSQHCDGASDPDSGAAEDDAQSCSYGSVLPDLLRIDAADDFCGADSDDYCSSGEEDDDGGGGISDDEDDGVVDQWCGRRKSAAKSNGCEDLKTMNESEGDRLFWEACLAS